MPTAEEARALPKYPLCMCVCPECLMVQLNVAIPSEVLFSHYVYETPRAASLEAHYTKLVEKIVKQRGGRPRALYEMGSNNGTFLEAIGDRAELKLGIEPARNLADMANERGLLTIVDFFGPATVRRVVEEYGQCDVLVARHCMAHLDDLRGTLQAISDVLVDSGIAVIENAYLLDTVRGTQFDQIYHEHMSYFAVTPMRKMLASVGLKLTHVMHSPVHGGSIVLFAVKGDADADETVMDFLTAEMPLLHDLETFAFRARACIAGIREGLKHLAFSRAVIKGLTGHSVSTIDSYGATAKGNTLMNVIGAEHCPVRYAVDSTPSKQGKFLPGTGVKVISEEEAAADYPEFYLLTAWNYEREILAKQADFRGQGGRFIVPLPYPRLV